MKKWVFALIVGLVMLFFGSGVANDDSSSVKCGDAIMGPGDVCEETRGGTTTGTQTYEEMKASKESAKRAFDTWLRWVLLGGGLVLAGFGVAGIVRHKRRAATAQQAQAPQQAPAPNQAPPPNFAPPQQYPPQPQYQQQQQYPPQDWGPRG